jgi:hypothetical protein
MLTTLVWSSRNLVMYIMDSAVVHARVMVRKCVYARDSKVAKLRAMIERRSAKTRWEKTLKVTSLVRVEVNMVT